MPTGKAVDGASGWGTSFKTRYTGRPTWAVEGI